MTLLAPAGPSGTTGSSGTTGPSGSRGPSGSPGPYGRTGPSERTIRFELATTVLPVVRRLPRWLDRPRLVLVGGLVLLAFAVSGPRYGLIGLVGVVTLALVLLAVAVPAVALGVLVACEFAGLPTVTVKNELPGLYTPVLVLGCVSVAAALLRKRYRARLRRPPLAPLGLLGVLVVSHVPASYYSVHPYETALGNEIFLKECVFLVVVMLLAWLVDRPWQIAALIVAPMAVIALLTLVNQVVLGSSQSFFGFASVAEATGHLVATDRHQGPLEDPNFWGQYLVLGLPFGCALVHRSVRAGRWWPAAGHLVVVLLLLVGNYLTGSRGALIAALVALGVWVVASGPRVRRRALQAVPVLLAVMLIPGVGNRLLDVGSAFEEIPAYAKDPSLVERAAAQQIAGTMFLDRPVFGSGPSTFAHEIYEYASRSPDLLIGVTTAPHNLYLQIAAEAGVVGLFGWLAMYLGICGLAVRSVLRLAGERETGSRGRPTRALAAAALAAAVGWAITSLFLHLALIRPVFVLFALIGTLALTTRDAVAHQHPRSLAATARAEEGLRTCAAAAVVTLVVAGAAGALLFAFAGRSYTAVARYTLTPAQGTYETYALDVRRRTPVLPAYAAMMQGDVPRTVTRVDAEPATGIITVTATGRSGDEARGRVAEIVSASGPRLRRFGADRQYRLLEVSPAQVDAARAYAPAALAAAALAVPLIAFPAAAQTVHLRRRGRSMSI